MSNVPTAAAAYSSRLINNGIVEFGREIEAMRDELHAARAGLDSETRLRMEAERSRDDLLSEVQRLTDANDVLRVDRDAIAAERDTARDALHECRYQAENNRDAGARTMVRALEDIVRECNEALGDRLEVRS